MRIDELLFPREVFPYSNLLDERLENLRFEEQQEILNEILPRIVAFCYEHVPGIRLLMQSHDVLPEKITNLRTFIEFFPRTNAQVIKDIGEDLFLPQMTIIQKTRHSLVEDDLSIVEESLVHVPGGSESLKLFHTKADLRASAQTFFRGAKDPALFGANFISLTKDQFLNAFFEEVAPYYGSTFLHLDERYSKEVVEKLTPMENVVLIFGNKKSTPRSCAFEELYKKNAEFFSTLNAVIYTEESGKFISEVERVLPLIHYGKLDGIIPTDINQRPCFLPHALWVKNGMKIKQNGRGRIVLNKLLAVYELENKYTHAMRDINRLHPAAFNGEWSKTSLYYGESIQRVEDLVREEDKHFKLTKETFFLAFAKVQKLYLEYGVVVGISAGSQLLRFHTAMYGEIKSGVLERVHAVNHTQTTKKQLAITAQEKLLLEDYYHHVTDSSLEISYAELTPIIKRGRGKALVGDPLGALLKNHIGGEVREASLLREVLDVKGEMPLYLQRIIDEEDMQNTLSYAQKWASESCQKLTIEEGAKILAFIYERILGNKELHQLFQKKSGILKDQIQSLLINTKSLTTKEHLEKTIAVIGNVLKRKPLSPVAIITSGNINFYDGFLIFSHVLLARMSNQEEGSFTVILRPSSADLILSSMIHYYHLAIKELGFSEEKKLHTLIQKINWDPKLYPQFLPMLVEGTKGGIYFGRGATYADVMMHSKHCNYGEGLNAGIVLADANLKEATSQLLDKSFFIKSKDCTAVGSILVEKSVFPEFMSLAKEYALTLSKEGSGVYEKRDLQDAQEIVKSLKGEIFGRVHPKKNTIDLILHATNDVEKVMGSEQPFPLIHVIPFTDYEDLNAKLDKIHFHSNLSAFTSINVFGDSMPSLEVPYKLLRENRCEFSPYEPHDGSFFLLNFLESQ